ncbi:MAG: hypothetical protein KIT56_01455 [Gammaproteobacteria bacterium]|nr:hypothetical protein [Gammaproteobacteria bacterium]MCW5582551.1 hypothetical protein [Gammaproteobacteria bacterium]
MNPRKSPALQLAEWAVAETRKAIPYSKNRLAYSQIMSEETPDSYLRMLQDLLRSDIKKRGSEEKRILDEIRRKVNIEFLPEDVLQYGIEKIFPLTIHALGRKFNSIESLFHYVSNRFKKTISERSTYTGLEYMEIQAIRGLKNRIGNCGETSAFATLWLMEYQDITSDKMPILPEEDIKLERVLYESPGDHSFVVLNRTSGEIQNISTWNDDAVICDPWIGVSYTIAQWKRWHKKVEIPPTYIIEAKYKLELNDPFRRWQKPYAFVGENHNHANNIPVHSDKWNRKHKQKNKPFRPIRLVSLDIEKDLSKIRGILSSSKKRRYQLHRKIQTPII